jgi:dienelactone hydrolase
MGGSAAIWLTKPYLYSEYSRLFAEQAPTIQANVAIYAGCFERVSTDRFLPIRTYFLNAELDNDTPAVYCEKFSDWMNSRGGNATFHTLKGQHHDFDAPYKLTKAPKAENPSECASFIDGSVRVWEKTGERFAMTADGYRDFQKKCVRSAKEAPVTTGYIETPFTGFKEWGDFFLKTLGAP